MDINFEAHLLQIKTYIETVLNDSQETMAYLLYRCVGTDRV